MATQWFLNHRGQLQGPFSESEIAEKIKAQALGPDDLTFTETESKWRPLSEIPQFNSLFKGNEDLGDEGPSAQREWVVLIRVQGKKRQQKGPFSTQNIRELLQSGQVKAKDYVWRKGMRQWYPIQGFPEFFDKEDQVTGDPPPQSDVSVTLKDVVELKVEVAPPEALPPEADGPDLVMARKDPRDDQDLIETKVGIRIPPKALAMARATVASESRAGKFVLAGLAVLIVGGFGWRYLKLRPKDPVVAQVAPVPQPTPVPRVRVVEASPPKPSRPPTPTPEPKKEPSYVRLQNTDRKLILVSDASSHFSVTLEFTSAFGEIIGQASYHRVLLRKERELDLGGLSWPRGFYQVQARIGDKEASARVFVGLEEQFQKELAQYKKELAFTFTNEKVEFIRASKSLSDQAKVFGQILARAGDERAWTRDYGPWRKGFAKTNRGTLRSIGPKSRNKHVIASHWIELKDLRSEMDKLSRRAGRKTERTDPQNLSQHRQLSERLTQLHQEAQSLSLWR